MPYTEGQRVVFPAKKLNRVGDELQLFLVYGLNIGSIADITAHDAGVYDIAHGALEWHYDLDEPFMVPSSYNLTIKDNDGFFRQRLFTEDIFEEDVVYQGVLVEYQAEQVVHEYNFANGNHQLEVWLYLNGNLEFFGYTGEDTLQYDEGSKTLTATAITNFDLINSQPLFDEDDVAINPLDYNLDQINSVYKYVSDIILDIYKLVYPAMTLSVKQDWLFATVWEEPPDDVDEISLFGDWDDLSIQVDFLFSDTGATSWEHKAGCFFPFIV